MWNHHAVHPQRGVTVAFFLLYSRFSFMGHLWELHMTHVFKRRPQRSWNIMKPPRRKKILSACCDYPQACTGWLKISKLPNGIDLRLSGEQRRGRSVQGLPNCKTCLQRSKTYVKVTQHDFKGHIIAKNLWKLKIKSLTTRIVFLHDDAWGVELNQFCRILSDIIQARTIWAFCFASALGYEGRMFFRTKQCVVANASPSFATCKWHQGTMSRPDQRCSQQIECEI